MVQRTGWERPGWGCASVHLLLVTLAAGPVSPAAAEDPEPSADRVLWNRIDSLGLLATGLRVDGSAEDWAGFPFFPDEDHAPPAEPALDILRMAVAPRESDLLVVLETAGRPSKEPFVFGLSIDFLGLGAEDAKVLFGAPGAGPFRLMPEDGKDILDTFRTVEVAVGEVVEIRVPLLLLASRFPGKTGPDFLAGRRRPFVRVRAWSGRPGAPAVTDEGPSVGSFLLARTPFPLDPPGPRPGTSARSVGFPLEGKWFVRQGAFGLWTHQDQWAYDFSLVDGSLQPSSIPGSRRMEDYPSFDRPVRAPEEGSVAYLEQRRKDNPPLADVTGKDSGNTLILRFADGLRLYLGHLRKDSVPFARREEFEAGARIGAVGNSGATRAPHLHLSVQQRPGDFTGIPLTLRDVRVGLNPGADDPWVRDLAGWEVREGFFVERLAPFPEGGRKQRRAAPEEAEEDGEEAR